MAAYDNFCAITESSNSTFPMTRLAVSTFVANNLWFDGTLIIATIKNNGLSQPNIDVLKSIYERIEILEIDHNDPIMQNVASKLLKKNIPLDRVLNYLSVLAFNIKSEGNIYFSRNTVFMGDVSDMLDANHLTAPSDSNSFPNSDVSNSQDINSKLMFVPSRYAINENYSAMVQNLSNINISEPLSENKLINEIVRKNNLNVRVLSNTFMCKSSNFIDQKYSNFVRYSKSIKSIYYNTHENKKNYVRIHTYWLQQNNSIQQKLVDTKKNSKLVNIKISQIKSKNSNIKPVPSNKKKISSDLNTHIFKSVISESDILTINGKLDSELSKNRMNLSFMDLSFFKAFIKDKSIALIANSSDLLKTSNGKLIDSHDVVIRFNSYDIQPEHTGSRTTIHVSIYLQPENLDVYVPIRYIISIHSKNWISKLKTLNKYSQGTLLKFNHHSIIPNTLKDNNPATSGFATLILLLKLGGYKKINMFGFNFYEGGQASILRKKEGMNYPISKVHDYALEKVFVLNNADSIDKDQNIITFYDNSSL